MQNCSTMIFFPLVTSFSEVKVAPIQLHPQLTKRFSDNTADGIGTVLNAMVGRSRGSRLGKQGTFLTIIKVSVI